MIEYDIRIVRMLSGNVRKCTRIDWWNVGGQVIVHDRGMGSAYLRSLCIYMLVNLLWLNIVWLCANLSMFAFAHIRILDRRRWKRGTTVAAPLPRPRRNASLSLLTKNLPCRIAIAW